MKHELKIHPQYYARVADGTKTFEVRDNSDRGFQMGDTVVLREWNPEKENATDTSPKGYTNSKDLEFTVGYVHVLNGAQVIFSLLPLPAAPRTKPKKVES
jgi:ASC-1-like (ASCH) protein